MSYWFRWQNVQQQREVLAKFNENHLPSGPGGGQFTSSVGLATAPLETEARSRGISISPDHIGPVQLNTNLKGKYRDVQKRAALQVALDPKLMEEEYKNLRNAKTGKNETLGGRILNTDLGRELFDSYNKDRTLSEAVHEPASTVVKALFQQFIHSKADTGQEQMVFFTSGGTGAGKTTATNKVLPGIQEHAIATLDANMSDTRKAIQRINESLDAKDVAGNALNNTVMVAYTYRDPVDALVNGALSRATGQEKDYGTGRTVPLSEHLKTHIGSYNTFKDVMDHFKNDPRVTFKVIDNSRGRDKAQLVDFSSIPNPAEIPAIMEKLKNALDGEYAARRISTKTYKGFMKKF